MKGRILVVERDDVGRSVMDLVLASSGHATDSVASISMAESALDSEAYALAVVDEVAGAGAILNEVRVLRRRWPKVPLIVTGTMLSKQILIELLSLGVMEALPKPFTPSELRDAVARVSLRSSPGEDAALDWAEAMQGCREASASGEIERADRLLRRALHNSGVDGEAMTLSALLKELRGDDAMAEREYRAAVALLEDASSGPIADPLEGIARLGLYRRAEVVRRVSPGRTAWLGDRGAFDDANAPRGDYLMVMTIGLSERAEAFVHLREAGTRAFAVSLGQQRPDALAWVLDLVEAGALHAPHLPEADVARILAARRAPSTTEVRK